MGAPVATSDLISAADDRPWVPVALPSRARKRPADRAEASAGAEHNVFSTVAHELRGPVTAMATSAELLVEDFDTLDPAQMRSMVGAIHRRALWLQGLVENLLCAATIREGRLQLRREAISLADVVADLLPVVEPLLAQKGQRLRVRTQTERELPTVLADSRRVGQVLVNLILNASKYSGRGTPIDVTITTRGASVRVAIADRGPGIPDGDAKRLFEPYYRTAGAAESGADGVGLGLTIVKSIVEAHGGQVGAENRPGGGARFWIELSARPVASVRRVQWAAMEK